MSGGARESIVFDRIADSYDDTRGGMERGRTVAAALAAVSRGASIVRVHDVRETVDALKVWRAVQEPE